MKTRQLVRLVRVLGHPEDFVDLIGTSGVLFLAPGNNWYGSGGDSVNLSRKRVTTKDTRIRVHTHLGNVFEFELIPQKDTL